jgi:hypothetical protein
MKRCSKCKQEKEFNHFCKNNRYKDGRHDTCKQCRKEYNKDNKEKIIEYEKQWRANNLDYGKQWRINNPGKYKILYTINNSKKTKEQITLDNKLSQSYKAEWTKDKYRKNPKYKLSQILRIRLLDALKDKTNKTESSLSLLGCTIQEIKQYLESQFKPEMTWENHGEIWEIDHIKPCDSFDLIDIEQQKQCFHYTNLQPLFKTSELAKSFGYINEIGNRNKSNKII